MPNQFTNTQEADAAVIAARQADLEAFRQRLIAADPDPTNYSFDYTERDGEDTDDDGLTWVTEKKQWTGGAGGGGTTIFSQAVEFVDPAEGDEAFLWVAAFDCTVLRVRGFRLDGTGATVNLEVGDKGYALVSDLSLAGTEWLSATADSVTGVETGDVLTVQIPTVSGSPTQVIVQVDFTT